MTEVLAAVQDASGRELISWKGEVSRITAVAAEATDGRLTMSADDKEVAAVDLPASHSELSLYVWYADDKLSEPKRSKVIAEDALLEGDSLVASEVVSADE